jgi:hypothetical protein
VAMLCFIGNTNAQKYLFGKWTIFCPTEITADNSGTICNFYPTELSPDNRMLTVKNLKLKITRKEIVILNKQKPVNIPYEWQNNSNSLVFFVPKHQLYPAINVQYRFKNTNIKI